MELDREDFRLWLAAKDPDEGVGTSGIAEECPLATYTRARTGDEVTVAPVSYGRPDLWAITGSGRPVLLPRWARQFATQVDGWAHTWVMEVSAKEALTILDGIDLPSTEKGEG